MHAQFLFCALAMFGGCVSCLCETTSIDCVCGRIRRPFTHVANVVQVKLLPQNVRFSQTPLPRNGQPELAAECFAQPEMRTTLTGQSGVEECAQRRVRR